jgi:RND family efflux transporter MFP subunit
LIAAPIAGLLVACAPVAPPAEPLRPVRTVELRYDGAQDANRYVGTVQARHEVEQGFRVGGKVAQRKVDVGQAVREGDVIAVLDDTDYRHAEEAARQQLVAATTQAKQAESDRQRLEALKRDGSVSASDDEKSRSAAQSAKAAAEAQAQQLELASNRLKYTVLRAPRSGVVTAVRFEVGQVVPEGQPIVSIAAEGEPEIVIDVPEDHLQWFKSAQYRASLASSPDRVFEVVLRELSPQAVAQTRTYRARLKPRAPMPLPLGATATLVAERAASDQQTAVIPASAITQNKGAPAVWIVRRTGSDAAGTVELAPVTVHGYRNEYVLLSGPAAGALVVTAGVQKMAPGKRVALPAPAANASIKEAAR